MRKLLFLFALLAAFASNAQDKPERSIPELLARLRIVRNDTAQLNLLLTIADAYVLKPGEEKSDLDSAFLLISQVAKANEKTQDPRIYGLSLLVKAKADREKGNKDSAKAEALRAVAQFRKYKTLYPADLAYADIEAANYYNFEDLKENTQRITLYQEAIPLFEATGRKQKQAETLQIMGDCLATDTINGVSALPCLLEAMKIFRSIGYTDLRYLYGLVGLHYSAMGDHRNALKYGLLSLAIEDSLPLSLDRYFTCNRVGITYLRLGNYPTAIAYFKLARDAAEHFHDTADIQQSELNLANAWVLQESYDSATASLRQYTRHYPFAGLYFHSSLLALYANIYTQTNRLPQAKPIIRELAATDSTLALTDFMHSILEPIIVRYYLKAQEFGQARQYTIEFQKTCLAQHLESRLPDPYRWLYQADSAQGRWEAALKGHEQYVRIRDSVLDVEKTKQLATMQLEFETEKKDRDIQNLTQKQQLDRLALRQASLTRNFIIGGSALLLILLLVMLGIAVNRYRLKQRNNQQLSKLLDEKEWLVKEIHHRVKNNLQTISGLLHTQVGFLKTPEAISVMEESRRRVDAMSLIHQRLYQSTDLSMTNMAAYIREFVDYLETSFNCFPRVAFNLKVQNLHFGLPYAIPLCLILNEAVTNAIKYAFPGDSRGEITITLRRCEGNRYLLAIADNGIGISDECIRTHQPSMGMSLMRGLSEDLDGHFTLNGKNGTRIEIVFEYEDAN